jgi:hypothetical protein
MSRVYDFISGRSVATMIGFCLPFLLLLAAVELDETSASSVGQILFITWSLLGLVLPSLTGINVIAM